MTCNLIFSLLFYPAYLSEAYDINNEVYYYSDNELVKRVTWVWDGRLIRNNKPINQYGLWPTEYIFVLTLDDTLLIDKYIPNFIHHTSLSGNTPVKAAGTITVKNGIVFEVTNRSGHYKPDTEAVIRLVNWLEDRNAEMRAIRFGRVVY